MGNARYEIIRPNGDRIEAGYAVQTVCEEGGCEEKIDRGLYYLCGNEPGGDEYGCGGYYCGSHLYLGSGAPSPKDSAPAARSATKRRWRPRHANPQP